MMMNITNFAPTIINTNLQPSLYSTTTPSKILKAEDYYEAKTTMNSYPSAYRAGVKLSTIVKFLATAGVIPLLPVAHHIDSHETASLLNRVDSSALKRQLEKAIQCQPKINQSKS